MPRRHVPADFPLRIGAGAPWPSAPPPHVNTSSSLPVWQKPIVTLVSVLAKTPYSDAKDTHRKPGVYISLQIKILKWLDTYASEQLTTAQAGYWTSSIDPISRSPAAEHAISLCYYMRSLGFDTYCRIDPRKDIFKLYVVKTHTNSRAQHEIYWKQNYKTGVSQYVAHLPTRERRRNAHIDIPVLGNSGAARTAGQTIPRNLYRAFGAPSPPGSEAGARNSSVFLEGNRPEQEANDMGTSAAELRLTRRRAVPAVVGGLGSTTLAPLPDSTNGLTQAVLRHLDTFFSVPSTEEEEGDSDWPDTTQ